MPALTSSLEGDLVVEGHSSSNSSLTRQGEPHLYIVICIAKLVHPSDNKKKDRKFCICCCRCYACKLSSRWFGINSQAAFQGKISLFFNIINGWRALFHCKILLYNNHKITSEGLSQAACIYSSLMVFFLLPVGGNVKKTWLIFALKKLVACLRSERSFIGKKQLADLSR